MNTYAQRWRLAVALKQPYPSPSDTGNFITDPATGLLSWFSPVTGESSIPGTASSSPARPNSDEQRAETQKSIFKVVAVVAGVGLVGALLLSRGKK
jgi:hypothetical protein